MQIIADLEIHSKYSRAVSPKMDLEHIACCASQKGIQLVATGDWQHPVWFKEITTKLKEVSPGIYELKNKPVEQVNEVKFLLSTEISSIFTQGGKQRRIHNLIFSPSMETSQKIIRQLQNRGANLMADGRPIVGLSSKDLLELVLSVDEDCLFIPAHVWTPWFGHYGSMSGFDSIKECFGNLSSSIYAMETGLSSDPWMNWQIEELETRSIVSFSDAHSGPKLGREATVFVSNTNSSSHSFSYNDIAEAIRQNPEGLLKIGYTIEFFPEEGKYHWSGHRNCGIRYNPQEVKEKGVVCPVCKRPLTIGVENRVLDLANMIIDPQDLQYLKNSVGVTFVYDKDKQRKPFVSLIPLLEILTEIYHGSAMRASREYERLTSEYAPEFDILLKKSLEDIELNTDKQLADAIRIVRDRAVVVEPGYDGVFGKVQIFKDAPVKEKKQEADKAPNQPTLF